MRDFTDTRRLIDSLPNAKQERALKLLEKVVFMDNELEKLQKILTKKGWTEEYQNGANQHGLKASSEATIYVNLCRQFTVSLKQLDEMLIKDETKQTGEELLNFIKKGK